MLLLLIETVAVTGKMPKMYGKTMSRAQTKYRERYSLRLFEISLEQVICTLFVIFSHPRHPTLASFSN